MTRGNTLKKVNLSNYDGLSEELLGSNVDKIAFITVGEQWRFGTCLLCASYIPNRAKDKEIFDIQGIEDGVLVYSHEIICGECMENWFEEELINELRTQYNIHYS